MSLTARPAQALLEWMRDAEIGYGTTGPLFAMIAMFGLSIESLEENPQNRGLCK